MEEEDFSLRCIWLKLRNKTIIFPSSAQNLSILYNKMVDTNEVRVIYVYPHLSLDAACIVQRKKGIAMVLIWVIMSPHELWLVKTKMVGLWITSFIDDLNPVSTNHTYWWYYWYRPCGRYQLNYSYQLCQNSAWREIHNLKWKYQSLLAENELTFSFSHLVNHFIGYLFIKGTSSTGQHLKILKIPPSDKMCTIEWSRIQWWNSTLTQ